MIFIETPTFTRLISALLEDEEYSKLQTELCNRPDAGDLIKNGGGIRVIYYWITEDNQILMLVAYPKSVKDNLTDKETSILRTLVKEL